MLVFYAIVLPASVWIIRRYMPPIRASRAAMRQKTEVVNAAFKEMIGMEYLTRAHGVQKTEYQNISSKVEDGISEYLLQGMVCRERSDRTGQAAGTAQQRHLRDFSGVPPFMHLSGAFLCI